MSGFTPKPTRSKSGRPIWWVASVIFHAILLGWLVFFSPARLIERKSSGGGISPGRARQIMEQVRERQAESLAARVRDVQSISQQLGELEMRKRDEFREFACGFNTNAPTQAEQAQAAARQ